MKIVYHILNTCYAGGLTRVLANKANYLAEHGYEVYVITTDQEDAEHYYPMSSKITFIDLGISYYLHDQQPLLQKLRHVPLKMYRHKRALTKVLKEIKADIVISLFGKEAFFLPGIKDGSKKVLEAHGSRQAWLQSRHGWVGRIQCWLDLWQVKRFDKFVVLTNVDIPAWGKLKHIVAIANANTFESEVVSSLNSKIVLAAGRYHYDKNFESLLQAWAIVAKKYPDWQLRLRGEGLHHLDPLIAKLGIIHSVSRENSKDIRQDYLESSIYTLTSRNEGLALVLLEAQVCGLPLVSYACKCAPLEIITHGENGFLVEPENYQALAERILQLIESPELRQKMGRQAKEHSKLFTQKVIMDKWEKLFAELTQTPSA